MKQLLAIALIMLALWPVSLAQTVNQASPDPAAALPKFTREQLREDFQIARRALEEGHSGIYRYTSKAELDAAFDRAEASLDRPMDAYEFFRVMAPTVARIKCGHTSIALPADIRQELNTRAPALPLQV